MVFPLCQWCPSPESSQSFPPRIQLSAIIAQSIITWFCTWYSNDWGKICIRVDIHKRHHISQSHPHRRILEKINCVIAAPHCISGEQGYYNKLHQILVHCLTYILKLIFGNIIFSQFHIVKIRKINRVRPKSISFFSNHDKSSHQIWGHSSKFQQCPETLLGMDSLVDWWTARQPEKNNATSKGW